MITTFSQHQITCAENVPFQPEHYSKFKFGDGSYAAAFGRELADGFIANHKDLLLGNKEIVIISSPYNSIPTASYAMTSFFKERLNLYLFEKNKSSLLESKIHRYKTYSADYGNLNYEDRVNLITTDAYHIDKSFLTNRVVLLLDDIKITGSHEYVIKKLITSHDIHAEFIFIYYAELANPSIEPNFENYLNYAFVKGLNDLVQVVNTEVFTLNTRIIKFILHSDINSLQTFLPQVRRDVLEAIVKHAISNNYHLMEEYTKNLHLVIAYLNNKN
ncbi:phosphoribosyltransferase family protein [Pontibacter kalidii]|uniref:phosphoribosyltransferase family protein n=1 Tax=Pontibacter kalidii TaxID=2592049 RepID=UPI00225A9097|nr:phosphoribosyltransferase family protein [Pontibacter kalidii]